MIKYEFVRLDSNDGRRKFYIKGSGYPTKPPIPNHYNTPRNVVVRTDSGEPREVVLTKVIAVVWLSKEVYFDWRPDYYSMLDLCDDSDIY